jgi:hypothetical protein
LARTALCGVANRNPRDPVAANRGVLLVDPFAGKTGMAVPAPNDLLTIASGVVNSLIQQSRYDTSDLALAVDPQNGRHAEGVEPDPLNLVNYRCRWRAACGR